MNIEQLRYFLQVVESGSVNTAAQKFYMTPQAINASLRKLEEEFETPLLVRSKKGITLTPQGHIFTAYAKEVIDKNEKMHLLLRTYNNQGSQLSGTLSLFSASIFTETLLPTVMHNFMQIFPQTIIKIMQINSADILSHFLNGYCDIAILSASKEYMEKFLQSCGDDKIKMLPLLSDRIVLCARTDHPLMQYRTISVETLTAYIHDNHNPISFFHTLTMDSDGMQHPRTISSSYSAELHRKLMLENNVVTCMPKIAYQTHFQNDGIAALPLSSDASIIHALLYREDPDSDTYELATRFIRTLKKYFEKQYGVYKAMEKE